MNKNKNVNKPIPDLILSQSNDIQITIRNLIKL